LSLPDDAVGGGAASRLSGGVRSTSNKKIERGEHGRRDIQRRMMEAAMLIQLLEYM
jgi:hypothetical protein